METISRTPAARALLLVLPSDADEPPWATRFPIVRSRFRGIFFEQIALPWIARGKHLYSMAGPAPLAKRNQTLVMHDAMPFRHPQTFRRAFVAWYWVMYGLLSRTAKRVLTVSSFSRAELAQTLKVPERRFDVAPCGSDHMRRGNEALTDVPLPFEPGSFALIVGNLAPHKNVQAAATALAAAETPTVVVGVAQQVFRATPIVGGDNLVLAGKVDDARLEQLYSAAGVLVAPSRYEGFGIPLVEAGRFGCPAVFALGSAMTEVAGDGGLGYPVDDMTECVNLAKRIITDRDLRHQLSEAASANADRFTWDRTARAIFGPHELHGPLRVLHVTETFSAGTGTAIIEYARAIKDQGVESFLLAQDRGSGLLDELRDRQPFAGAQILEPGLLTLWGSLRRTVADLRPDVVHLHSSKAGAVGRLQPPLPGRPVIVYSPHCFAFERRDISKRSRWFYRLAELVLARRTDAFLCVSPHEAQLAETLDRSARVHDVLNAFGLTSSVAQAESADSLAEPDRGGAVRIVTVGRVAPQKDPSLFLHILQALRATDSAEATWVGNGSVDDSAELETAGVSITGWLAAADVSGAISNHTVYLHTAGWEASVPIAVLDAMVARLPVVVKRNPAYRGLLPEDWQFDTVAEAVEMIRELAKPAMRLRRIHEQLALLDDLRKRSPDLVIAEIYREVSRR